VPVRAAGTVLGTLGLFGTRVGTLTEADLLVAQTLAHVACVAILQDHRPTPATVVPPLQAALTDRIIVDQATGFVSERLDVSIEDAFRLLRRYARTGDQHLTDAARYVIGQTEEGEAILVALRGLTPPR
jgi:hypothetical protein